MNCLLAAESPPTLCSSALYYSHNSTSPGKQKIATFRGAHSIEIWRYSFIQSVSGTNIGVGGQRLVCVCAYLLVQQYYRTVQNSRPKEAVSAAVPRTHFLVRQTPYPAHLLSSSFSSSSSSTSSFSLPRRSAIAFFFFFFAAPFQSPLIVREDRQGRRKENRKEESRCALWFVGRVVVAVASSASSLT